MFNFKKCFGQNFLVNTNIIDAITNCVQNFDQVIEIGPGNGALTKSLLSKKKRVQAIEIDIEAINLLKDLDIELIYADILDYELPNDLPLIGNLPYNISAKIVSKIVYSTVPYAVFMFQKEVADILTGNTFNKLTVFAQARYNIKKFIDVKAGNFYPIPKVDSQVVILERHNLYDDVDLMKLKEILLILFNNRRKMLRSALKKYPEIMFHLINLGIDLNLRVENLSKEIFYQLVLSLS